MVDISLRRWCVAILSIFAVCVQPNAAENPWSKASEDAFEPNFFRLRAHYSYQGRPIDFDIVVGCYIRAHHRHAILHSYAVRYPYFFILPTGDGHEIMQVVPIACRGETTENGLVPKDFLPGVVWFDEPKDYRLGVAYFSEDAFESPKSRLKFLGASIQKATERDWERFEYKNGGNPGLDDRYFDPLLDWTSNLAKNRGKGRRSEFAEIASKCSGVRRYKLSERGREVLRKYWPRTKPQYWATSDRFPGPWEELQKVEKHTPILEDGIPYAEHFIGASYRYAGFPTRARGGMANGATPGKVASEIFPVRNDWAVPWVFTDEVVRSKFLTRQVEVEHGLGKGFLYCFRDLKADWEVKVALPEFLDREARLLVDGARVETPDVSYWGWPSPFFERDEFIYFKIDIAID